MRETLQHLMAAANAVIDTVSVHDAIYFHATEEAVFVDLRRDTERATNGTIPGAIYAPRGHLEFFVDPESSMHQTEFDSGKRLLLYCASGGRSALAAKTLVDMGVPKVAHIAGGFEGWQEAGGPTQSVE